MLSMSFMNLSLDLILLHLSVASLVTADATADSLAHSTLHDVGSGDLIFDFG